MKASNRRLQLQHMGSKMQGFAILGNIAVPSNGWIRAIRTALNMSMQQLGKRLSMTKQGVQDIERREKEGSITLKSLRETAHALDMQLVYGFVPQDGTLEKLIERKATELATQIVLRTSNTMKLEDQENDKKRIEQAIRERTAEIVNETPRILWD